MLIKTLQFIILILISLYSFGVEVESLNQGSCYYHLDTTGEFKVASFNDGKSFSLHPVVWNDFLDELGALKADSLIHCSGQGARMVVNFESSKGRECVWAKVNRGIVEILDRDLSAFDSGLCDGVLEDRLIVSFQKNGLTDTENFEQIESQLDLEIVDIQEISRGVYEMVFESTSDDVFMIKKMIDKTKLTRYVDLVTRQRPAGDYKVIEELSK